MYVARVTRLSALTCGLAGLACAAVLVLATAAPARADLHVSWMRGVRRTRARRRSTTGWA